ncbi:pyridoxamine 5'-phosphate oxidase family protein [Georgenia sp. 311]|uniref:Pyridoxamine 5'-phosphate oxidase family protein n=1 Tax=Georgenia wutianyii TaxID=2585135 RepID=A0ABX5VQD7_9MICO|nr:MULTISPECIES: pyridoxamine 5'-phosphate oxidase family protein [Georgenia]QDB80460.1 pyridoxamine 5'-phosphate oxidase family protein [Georgenia wutianyii]TNC18327.1 pyridoxamine 5'-phosphate oxidase family protein [Georgenia sp. 311]
MRTPDTSLDPRFSDPDAVPTPWSTAVDALATAQLCWLTTVRRDGRPHVTPLVAVALDDAVHFCSGPAEQKTLNLRHDPHVALLTGSTEWDRGLDVVLEGRAVRTTEQQVLRRLAGAWGEKWDGQWQFDVRDGAFRHADGGEALVFTVTPDRAFAFAKNPFGQTRYVF